MHLYDTVKNLSQRALRNREFQIVFGMNVIVAVGGLVANRLLTKYVPAGELAEVFLIAIGALWLTLPAAGMYLAGLHLWPIAKEKGQILKYSKVIEKFSLYQIVLILISSLAIYYFSWFSITTVSLFLSLFFLAAGQGLFQLTSAVPLAERQRITTGLLDLFNGNTGKYTFIIAGILLIGQNNAATIIPLQAAHAVLLATVAYFIYRRIVKRTLSISARPNHDGANHLDKKVILSYFIPTVATALITQIITTSERWSLNSTANKDSISYFVLSVGLAVAASNSLNSIVVQYFYPQLANEFAKSYNSNLFKTISKKFLILSLALQLPILVLFLFFPDFLTAIFFDSSYGEIAQILPTVFFGAFCLTLSNSLASVLYSLQKAVSLRIGHAILGLIYAIALAGLAYFSKLNLNVVVKTYAAYQFFALIYSFIIWVRSRKIASSSYSIKAI